MLTYCKNFSLRRGVDKNKWKTCLHAWLLPSFIDHMEYGRARDINFTSAKKMKADLDYKISKFHSGVLTPNPPEGHFFNPNIEGFQRPTLGPVRQFDTITSEFLQILHVGNNQWVSLTSIGCLPGEVKLLDSLMKPVITQELQDLAQDLYGPDLNNYKHAKSATKQWQ